MMFAQIFAIVLIVGLVYGIGDHPPLPKFPQSFTVNEADDMAIFQGEYSQQGDSLCCAENSNCEVQTEASSGVNYVDAVNQRTRFDQAGATQSIVTFCDQSISKECLVDADMKCKEYCPIECEVGGFGPDPNATYAGEVVVNGVTYQQWKWEQTILGIIVMEVSYFLADQSNPSNPIPYKEIDLLTPFGEHIGGQNSTWTGFKAGVPDKSKFAVTGLSDCPQSPNCNSNARQLNRRRNRFMRAYYNYKYGAQ